jgi:hypothetical protein
VLHILRKHKRPNDIKRAEKRQGTYERRRRQKKEMVHTKLGGCTQMVIHKHAG